MMMMMMMMRMIMQYMAAPCVGQLQEYYNTGVTPEDEDCCSYY